MIQDLQNARVMPDFLPGSVTGALPEIGNREKFSCSYATGAYAGSWPAPFVSLQVIR